MSFLISAFILFHLAFFFISLSLIKDLFFSLLYSTSKIVTFYVCEKKVKNRKLKMFQISNLFDAFVSIRTSHKQTLSFSLSIRP